jgi:hypothetical protein
MDEQHINKVIGSSLLALNFLVLIMTVILFIMSLERDQRGGTNVASANMKPVTDPTDMPSILPIVQLEGSLSSPSPSDAEAKKIPPSIDEKEDTWIHVPIAEIEGVSAAPERKSTGTQIDPADKKDLTHAPSELNREIAPSAKRVGSSKSDMKQPMRKAHHPSIDEGAKGSLRKK